MKESYSLKTGSFVALPFYSTLDRFLGDACGKILGVKKYRKIASVDFQKTPAQRDATFEALLLVIRI